MTISADSEALLGLLERDHGLLAGEQLEQLERQRETWRHDGIEVISALDAAYPENLRAAADRPALIFVAGQLVAEDARSVAVIGSRRATQFGEAVAREIAGQLVTSGYTVNSGLAVGIDTAAHTEALSSGGRTVAVLGTGLGHCYPIQNRGLQKQIAEPGGRRVPVLAGDPAQAGELPLAQRRHGRPFIGHRDRRGLGQKWGSDPGSHVARPGSARAPRRAVTQPAVGPRAGGTASGPRDRLSL